VADARRNPGKLNYASTGTGSVPHLALASLSSAASLNVVHVPYKGEADMLQGLLNGSVTMFLGHPTLLSVHAQTMRGIAVLAPQRLKEFPDMPTVGEQGVPPQHFEVWGGLVTPKGTPPAVLAALEAACRSGTAAEAFRKQLDNLNTPVMYQDAATFGAFVSAEFERNARLLREAGIKPE
jgi:tripartite-type tricarboxylate transporter receptor subunit TctC